MLTSNASNGEGKRVTHTLTTDKNGEAVFTYKQNRPYLIYAFTATDKANAETSLRDYYAYWKSSDNPNRMAAYTDRALYRQDRPSMWRLSCGMPTKNRSPLKYGSKSR